MVSIVSRCSLALVVVAVVGCGDPSTIAGNDSTSGTSDDPSTSATMTGDPTTASTTMDSSSSDPTTLTTTADTSAGTTDPTDATTSTATSDATSSSTDPTAATSSEDDSSSSDEGTTGEFMLPDFSGDFLLAAATVVDPNLPFQWIATFDFTGDVDGGTVDVELQPLALDEGSTTSPRTFFGQPLAFPDVPVAADGTFSIDIGPLTIAAETNPIIAIDAEVEMAVFDGQVLDADTLCGTFGGDVVSPIMQSLDGSTFGAIRVLATDPDSLPAAFPSSCE
jgi:hypothetical protein